VASRFAFFVLAFLVLTDSDTAQTNLLVNPGFETGDFTGWTATSSFNDLSVTGFAPHGGSFVTEFSVPQGVISSMELKQSIPPVPTDQIGEISFWVRKGEDVGLALAEFRATYTDGSFSTASIPNPGMLWTHIPMTGILDPGKMLSEIRVTDTTIIPGAERDFFDDFLVELVAPSPVPLMGPGTLAMVAVLITGAGVILVRRQRR